MFVKNSLSGARVLVVEDDHLLAVTIASVLEHESALIVGPCASHRAAMDVVNAQLPHLALLDVNILGGTSFELAEWLASQNVPFAFVTGEPMEQIPKGLAYAGYLKKPAHALDLLDLVRRMWVSTRR